jgi:5-formyltetrahydrofolate cyclo-ligase
MQPVILEAKSKLRGRVRAELKQMHPEERAAASAHACALLRAQTRWQAARSVLFYAPMPEELDVWPLLPEALGAGKKIFLPRFVAETRGYEACEILDPVTDLQAGRFGIREPVSHAAQLYRKRVDFILVPGVAFDLAGHRLGRGRGYYDQLLEVLEGTTCGVAFDQQIRNLVPIEPHDVRLDCILTPTRWIELKA